MSFYISVLTSICINLVGVLSIYVITGMTGMFSLGQASFMAIGAYTAGVLTKNFGFPFFLSAIIAVLVGLLFGLFVGLPTIRLRKDYIALVTFGFGEAIIAVLNNMTALTGGAMGLSGIPKKTTLTIALGSVIVITFFVWNLKKSRFGRQCMAMKEDELAARSMGINVDRIKLTAFLIASAITAYAGVLYGFYTTYVDPTIFTWNRSAEWIIVVVFGGVSSLTGSLFSGVLLGLLPELLRSASEWRIVIYCVIVLIIINFRPQGLFGHYEFSLKRFPKDIKRLLTLKKGKAADTK
ncbi:branched-chain amino acid ABC transporter permease [Oscillospiraceae bacterium PP1C4]